MKAILGLVLAAVLSACTLGLSAKQMTEPQQEWSIVVTVFQKDGNTEQYRYPYEGEVNGCMASAREIGSQVHTEENTVSILCLATDSGTAMV